MSPGGASSGTPGGHALRVPTQVTDRHQPPDVAYPPLCVKLASQFKHQTQKADDSDMTGKQPPASVRRLASVVVAGLCVLLLAACMTAEQTELVDLTNRDRAANGDLPALAPMLELNAKAQGWAETMAGDCRLRHSDLTAGVPAGWTKVGENVAYNSSVAAAEAQWMNSGGHRANILSRDYTHIGVGVAAGNCFGFSQVWVVQVFARY